MPIAYQFLPWVRRGLAVALDAPDTLGADLPARGSATVGVTLAGGAAGTAVAPLAMKLHGPGDVIGIDTRLVVRTDPKPDVTNFEPNYFAIIDFDPPDFPWMLTPARARGDDRLRPWLVLVVLDRAKAGPPRLQPQALLPSIKVPAAEVANELPPLSESWSWAHAQVVSGSASNDLAGLQRDLQGNPASNVSRLICPRRLQPNRDYVACLVPAFEPGRLRGLGLAGTNNLAMDVLSPAWDVTAAADVVLPVYHHWAFSTGPAGDFESLARRLRTPGSYKGTPLEAQLKAVGTAPMAVDDLLNGATPGLETTMEGALVPISYKPGQPPHDTQAESLEIVVNTPKEQVDNPVVDEPGTGAVRRIEVKAPLAGAWHAKQHEVHPPAIAAHWLAGLNLNPRYRGAAGYGYEVVRRNQEDYVDACWDQVGDIRAAELRFNLTRLAIEAQLAMRRKHFDPLPPDRLLQLMGPALSRIEALGPAGPVLRIGGQLASIGGQIDRTSLPMALTETALRRAVSPNRRALRLGARMSGTLARLPAATSAWLGQMANATRKRGDTFAVNEFVPDGILGTRLFDGVNLDVPERSEIDLTGLGFGRRFTAQQLRQVATRAVTAKTTFATRGEPKLVPRAGAKGVFVDQHVERFGGFVAVAPGLTLSDWGSVATQLETLGGRGAEGVLLEANAATHVLQFSAMSFEANTGALKLDRSAPIRLGADRVVIARGRAVPAPPRVSAADNLGRLQLPGGRQRFNVSGLIGALPPNAVGTGLQRDTVLQFDPSFEVTVNRPPIGRPPVDRPPVERVPEGPSITLPPPLTRPEVLTRFAEATKNVQRQWADPYATAQVAVQAVDFGLAQAAEIVRARTHPELTLTARLASTVSIAKAALGAQGFFVGRFLDAGDLAREQRYMIPALFDRVMAWPKLREPMYAALAGHDREAFMPGIGNLPQDLIMLVQVNQYFIDAFMVGANFEMNRELLWRGFPTDLRGTPFQRFWGRLKAGADGRLQPLDDMAPIHQWGRQPLGRRSDPNLTDPNRIALLVRGQLLRRYPNTAVYAWKRNKSAPADQTQLLKDASGNPPAGAVETPVFAGFIGPDITFFGFDIDREKVGDWCFVLEEPMSEPRFGFDVEERAPEQGGLVGPRRRLALKAALQASAAETGGLLQRKYNPYKALSWSHLAVTAGAHLSIGALALQGSQKPFPSFPSLSETPTSAEIAKVLLQEPFRAYFVGPDLAT